MMKILLVFLFTMTANGKVLNFETTRLKSTAGAGVASLLMNEATVSNPAPLAFFNVSSIYIEKFGSVHSNTRDQSFTNDNYAIIASDSTKHLKGSISYIDTRSNGDTQKQFNIALASNIGRKSAAGITYRKIKKKYKYKDRIIYEEYKQYIPGVFHSVNRNLTLGIIAIDPLRKQPKESKIVIGLQMTFFNYLNFMIDTGADYKEDLSTTAMIRGAVQVRVLDDFFVRFGAFEDKALRERGSGFGIGWVQPKLVINFALKNTRVLEDELLFQEQESIEETSFSLAYRF